MREWFESWFDTSYYHILYQNRDYSEAELFIKNLFNYLDLAKDGRVLDLACGKGRHSIFVNSLGFNTMGVDLSRESIEEAKKNENSGLKFEVHDMRDPIEGESFDLVLNLFTSFGYFESTDENQKVLNAVSTYLNPNGKLVIDFLNPDFIRNNIVEAEQKEIDGIKFKISKSIQDEKIIKNISFEDKGKQFDYQEKVQLIDKKEFERLLTNANFEIENVFGDYQLSPFTKNSERLIIVAKKK
ncbi:class I SAM-dependent DNA methyltransferase [Crocinitomix algicola]|uniref:class I SAM-dependent DNA methyltransferase n=1 Tax=Crocinitomix algicola TaxID=1740263 RepID=UPI000834BC43|nr:class I SAM-dependent methyltransferase [Crocinitomix algicola]